jgi:hypothetical protein
MWWLVWVRVGLFIDYWFLVYFYDKAKKKAPALTVRTGATCRWVVWCVSLATAGNHLLSAHLL